jgi:hypothetical protein
MDEPRFRKNISKIHIVVITTICGTSTFVKGNCCATGAEHNDAKREKSC